MSDADKGKSVSKEQHIAGRYAIAAGIIGAIVAGFVTQCGPKSNSSPNVVVQKTVQNSAPSSISPVLHGGDKPVLNIQSSLEVSSTAPSPEHQSVTLIELFENYEKAKQSGTPDVELSSKIKVDKYIDAMKVFNLNLINEKKIDEYSQINTEENKLTQKETIIKERCRNESEHQACWEKQDPVFYQIMKYENKKWQWGAGESTYVELYCRATVYQKHGFKPPLL